MYLRQKVTFLFAITKVGLGVPGCHFQRLRSRKFSICTRRKELKFICCEWNSHRNSFVGIAERKVQVAMEDSVDLVKSVMVQTGKLLFLTISELFCLSNGIR